MEFSTPARRPRGESVVPMINVVFLLLIFFLMTSQIAPPEPLEVNPPTAGQSKDTESDLTIFVDKTGSIAFQEFRGDVALEEALKATSGAKTLQLRADADLEAQKLAGLLKALSGNALHNVELVVVPQ